MPNDKKTIEENEPFKFILYDEESDTSFECKWAMPTAKKRAQLLRIQEERMIEYRDIAIEHTSLFAVNQLDKQKRNEEYEKNPELSVEQAEVISMQKHAEDRALLKVTQCAVNVKTLSDRHRELVESDVRGAFWSGQDWEVITEVSKRFRAACEAGRRSYYTAPKISDLERTSQILESGGGTRVGTNGTNESAHAEGAG